MGKDLLNDVNPVIDLEKKEIVYHLPKAFYLMLIIGVVSAIGLVWIAIDISKPDVTWVLVLFGIMMVLGYLYIYYIWRPVTLDKSGIHLDKQNWTWGEVDKCRVFKEDTKNGEQWVLSVHFANGKSLRRVFSPDWQPEQIRDAVDAVAGKDICELEPAKGE